MAAHAAHPGVADRVRKLTLRRPNRSDLLAQQPASLDPIPAAPRPDASMLGSVWKLCFPGGGQPAGSLPRDNGGQAVAATSSKSTLMDQVKGVENEESTQTVTIASDGEDGPSNEDGEMPGQVDNYAPAQVKGTLRNFKRRQRRRRARAARQVSPPAT